MMNAKAFSARSLALCLLALAPLALGAWLFYQTLDFLYVWDDELLLAHPLRGETVSDFALALRDALGGFVINPQMYWRPLSTLSFWWPAATCATDACVIEYARAINYAVYLAYLAALIALARLAIARAASESIEPSRRLGPLGSALCALAGSALVGLHPANAEIFAWISGRFDALLSLWLTLALALSWTSRGPAALRLTGLFALFCLAQLSKDGAQVGCALIALLAFASNKPSFEKWGSAAAFALSALLIGALRAAFAGGVSAQGFLVDLDPALLLSRYASGSGQAFLSLAQPWIGVSPAHPITLGAKEIIACALFHAALLISLAACARAWRRRLSSRLPWALCVCVCVTVLITCAINAALKLNQDFIWADRYLAPAWPFLAAAISLGLREAALALGPARAKAWMAPSLLVGAAILAASSVALRQEVGFWRDNVFFWNRVVQEDPDNIKSVTNYTLALYQAGKLELAEREADRGIAIMRKRREGFYEMVRMASAIKLALGKNEEAKELIASWQRQGFDAFDLRVQQALIGYAEKDCAAGDAARAKALDFSKSLPAYKIQRELPLMASLSAECAQR